MANIDEQFVAFVVKSLVNNPDAVQVDRTVDEKGVLLELTVDPEDLGRVIGKRGATAQSLRTLLRALGTKNEARYNLKIVDNGEQSPSGQTSDSSDDTTSSNDTSTDEDTAESDAAEESDTTDESTPSSSSYSKTRRELEDLDDLDV
jgi:predicted RNA-binding protein YlqC (UPF0109 family)